MKDCIICEKPEGRYKCPTCLIYYCSVSCCKKHRKENCALARKPIESKIEKVDLQLSSEHTVPFKKLKLLETNSMKGILANPHLRNIILKIDKSDNPANLMQKAMMEPIFREFADSCLSLLTTKED